MLLLLLVLMSPVSKVSHHVTEITGMYATILLTSELSVVAVVVSRGSVGTTTGVAKVKLFASHKAASVLLTSSVTSLCHYWDEIP
jgi:hypothetical protein